MAAGLTITIAFKGEPSDPPRAPFDGAAMARLGSLAIALVRRRTLQGIGADGRPFAGYSEDRIYIGLASETAARLKPKGGVLSRTGRSMRFDGGYREYKDKSRKGAAGTAEVDLTLSGELLRSLQVRDVRQGSAIVAMSDRTLPYGRFVHDRRPFMGLTRPDEDVLTREAERIADEALGVAPGQDAASSRITDSRQGARRVTG